MYGAYVEVAAYNRSWERGSSRRSSLHSDCLSWMPTEYFEVPTDASATWSSRNEGWSDFILVCEVSEIEGPKPLFTVPRDVDTVQDINTLAEKMMSVDYHGGTGSPFMETNDTQIVLSTVMDGLHAFVNYFLLYDICARGFVRPMCIAYLTSEKKKIIDYFEPLRCKMLEVTRYLKFGNRRLFLNEVELYLDDLLAAKDAYVRNRSEDNNANCVTDAEGCAVRDNAEDNVTIDLFASNITEAQQMCSAEKPILDDASAAALFWKVETKLKSHFNRNLYECVKAFVLASPMHSPKLSPFKNSTNCEMRTIFELCSWGIVIGLNLLVTLQKFYKRDIVTIYMESEDLRLLEEIEEPLMMGTHLLADVTGFNDLGTNLTRSLDTNDETSLNFNRNLSELQSLFANAEVKRDCLKSVNSADDFVSDDNQLFDDALDESHFALSTSDCRTSSEKMRSSSSDSSTKEVFWSAVESLPESSEEIVDDNESEKDSDKDSSVALKGEFVRGLQRSHSRCAMATLLCQSIASHVDFLTPDKAGYGIATIFNLFPNFVHVLYSLLVGRPVLVTGSAREEDLVRSVVQAFDLFVPEKNRSCNVIPWCTMGLGAKNMSKISLMGLYVPNQTYENQILTSSLKQKVSLVNVSKKSYQGPTYSGNILSCLTKVRRMGWDDAAFIAFLHSLLLAFAARVSLYHRFVRISSSATCDKNSDLCELPQKSKDVLLSALSLSKDDANVVQHLTELLIYKMQDS